MIATDSNPVLSEFEWLLRAAKAPKFRTMRQFAEQEIIIPDGPFRGQRFRTDRQPFAGLWFDLAADPRYNRRFALGCTQSGKSLCAFVIPCLYHLFEIGETVICGLPDMDMAADKWREDLLPALEKTRYRELVPSKGAGSRGGQPDAIQFTNGATLKFMSGGGGDKSRAGFTSRVVVVTEVDGLDLAGEASREADKFTQIEARTLAYGEQKQIYGECTVSIEAGRIWTEHQAGTGTEPHLKCPHCQQFVRLEREHLVGWQNATTEAEAAEMAQWSCSKCGELWSETDRKQANRGAIALHRGQAVDGGGHITGELPRTRTLSFRWHAAHNFFYDAAYVGVEEWKASRAVDEENAEKKQRQFLFSLPHVPAAVEAAPLTAHGIQTRIVPLPRGMVPADTEYLTIGCDLGKWLCHWILLAFRANGQIHVVDYGRIEVPSDQFGEQRAILSALNQLKELSETGWMHQDAPPGQQQRQPDEVWIDAGYQGEVVYQFCRASGEQFRPVLGRGVEQRSSNYVRPKARSKTVKYIGDEYHLGWNASQQLFVIEINTDHWKSFVHDRLAQVVTQPGAMTLFQALPRDHLPLAKHLTAETKVQEFVGGKGLVTKWVRKHRNNHWFDAADYACVAGNFCGFELVPITDDAPGPEHGAAGDPLIEVHTPDGRAYLVTER